VRRLIALRQKLYTTLLVIVLAGALAVPVQRNGISSLGPTTPAAMHAANWSLPGLALGWLEPEPPPLAVGRPVPAVGPDVGATEPDPAAELDAAFDNAAGSESEATVKRRVAIAKRSTLSQALLQAGIDRSEAQAAVDALAAVHDLRKLKRGQEVSLTFGADRAQLLEVRLGTGPEKEISALRLPDGSFEPRRHEIELFRRDVAIAGVIEDSLYRAALPLGVPPVILEAFIKLYAYDVDFQRQIQPGDRFELLFEAYEDASGTAQKFGELLYARLRVGDEELTLYRFRDRQGNVDYYNRHGESVRKALLRTPLDGARITSNFGMRLHPILGFSMLHKGMDFGAPPGTPVYAAGDGSIEEAGWNGAYGLYVRIKHDARHKTAYAHLANLARGIREGRRVQQGEVIGYVGSTGRSTGPHLHYEVIRDSRQVNPISVKFPTGRKLESAELAQFRGQRGLLEYRMAAGARSQLVAQGDAGTAVCAVRVPTSC